MNSLRFQVLWTDSDTMLSLAVTVSGSTHSTYHETYLYPETLTKFAAALENFPWNGATEASLESGAKDPQYHDYLRLRVFLIKPTGQSALEVESEVRGAAPLRAEAHFYVRGLPMDFNRVGAAINAWLTDTSAPLRVEWEDSWE
ncbi:hypothetical protein ACFPN2_24165 [Steroidobacter flavus]|uniref:Uncharacterized protein n=1 Tax=Steroidobacter flavus TaxID=1842136 RepID=A0ABV8SX65_9GAMM